MKQKVWYETYDEISSEITNLKNQLNDRCRQLGVSPSDVLSEIQNDVIARAVHESNWQEGIYLDEGRTRLGALE